MLSWPALVIVLVILLLISAFFSSSETAMMAVNRYRLRHRARQGDKKAKRILILLERTDSLLGIILLGNTFFNVLASTVATVLAVHYFHRVGVLLAPIVLTLVILIAAETAPKTYAAIYSERVAQFASGPLRFLLKVLYPLVFLVNTLSAFCLRVFRVRLSKKKEDALTADELSQVVRDASSTLTTSYQSMLLRILSLEQVTIDDVMIPKQQIIGLDTSLSMDTVTSMLAKHRYRYWPVYEEDVNHVIGILCMHDLSRALFEGDLSWDVIRSLLREVHFLPEGTSLSNQLMAFQTNQSDVGMVVDEYGDIIGLLTMQDILEEIVGDFAGKKAIPAQKVKQQKDGSYVVDATISIRDLNRLADLNLPLQGPKTVSGFLVEELGVLPSGAFCMSYEDLVFEVLHLESNVITKVRLSCR